MFPGVILCNARMLTYYSGKRRSNAKGGRGRPASNVEKNSGVCSPLILSWWLMMAGIKLLH